MYLKRFRILFRIFDEKIDLRRCVENTEERLIVWNYTVRFVEQIETDGNVYIAIRFTIMSYPLSSLKSLYSRTHVLYNYYQGNRITEMIEILHHIQCTLLFGILYVHKLYAILRI